MDYFQFIASIIDSLAWPVAVVLIILLLRKAILRLLRRIKIFRYKDIEFEFSEKLAEVERDASKLGFVINRTVPDVSQVNRYATLAQISPNAAILEAWSDVELAVLELAREKAPDFPKIKTFTSKLRLLHQIEVIDDQTAALIDDLRALRNLAAHPDNSVKISTVEAERYGLTALRAASALRELSK